MKKNEKMRAIPKARGFSERWDLTWYYATRYTKVSCKRNEVGHMSCSWHWVRQLLGGRGRHLANNLRPWLPHRLWNKLTLKWGITGEKDCRRIRWHVSQLLWTILGLKGGTQFPSNMHESILLYMKMKNTFQFRVSHLKMTFHQEVLSVTWHESFYLWKTIILIRKYRNRKELCGDARGKFL